jgi:hypothetical protein
MGPCFGLQLEKDNKITAKKIRLNFISFGVFRVKTGSAIIPNIRQ